MFCQWLILYLYRKSNVLTGLALFIICLYGVFCVTLLAVWWTWPAEKNKGSYSLKRKISVLIPVRNEAANILNLLSDIENQVLSKDLYEVLVIDDSSTDATPKLVKNFAQTCAMSLHLVELPHAERNSSPKKRALNFAMENASGEIIVTTDGDCRVKPGWLLQYSLFFEKYRSVFVSAPVIFHHPDERGLIRRLWTKIQQIEFASLIVSGAVSMKMGFPNMCSGANMGYLKTAFLEVGGFTGNEHLASGDDEFLMHKMNEAFPRKVNYLKSQEAVVSTMALPDLKSFYNQRKRWASKWSSYQTFSPKIMAFFIFSSNACLIYSLFAWEWPLILVKLLPEFLFLAMAVVLYRRISLIFLIPFVQVIYPFYVVFFGISSLRKMNYTWKERNLS